MTNDILTGSSPSLPKEVTHGTSGNLSRRIGAKRLVKLCAVLTLIVCTPRWTCGQAANDRNTAAAPILVELFTSEGCSSCPPADDLLQQMDASQPAPGAQLIVLSEHVDYWNHDGWQDPYSSAQLTDRQTAYVRALGLNTPYTPQIIVDGATILRGNNAEVAKTFQRLTAVSKIAVRIESVSVEAKTPAFLRAHIAVDGTPQKHSPEIYVVVALDHAESQVLRGENSGKHLAHVAVVQEIRRIGKLEKAGSFGQDFQLKLKPGTDPANIRLVAFVQEPGPGKVLGAALYKVNN
jgi:hypothetical protein